MRYLYSVDNLEKEIEKVKEIYNLVDVKVFETEKEGFQNCIEILNPKRIFNIKTEDNNLKLYGKIDYTQELKYYTKEDENARLQVWEEVGQTPDQYTVEDIKNILIQRGIKIGVIEDGISKLINNPKENILIGEGIEPINDAQDSVEVCFENKIKNFEEATLNKIDFRNMYSIAMVKVGDIIGEKIIGKEGRDGLDVFGKKIPKISKKKFNILAVTGCEVVDNKVIARIDGKPSINGNTFSVTAVYSIPNHVDMNTGNINFLGEVVIEGGIKEGMKVTSGNGVIVKGNIENAEIEAKGNVLVGGNIISSTIKTGAKDVEKNNTLTLLEKYGDTLKELMLSLIQLKEYNGKTSATSDGELLKVLIESKHKALTTLAMSIITLTVTGNIEDKRISEFVKTKIMGLGPLNIKFGNEIYSLISMIEMEVLKLREKVDLKLDVNLAYCQDSKIEASGDVNILGKGQYISEIKALGKINFTNPLSVCRGGTLEARYEINGGVIGTPSGAITTLKVDKGGVVRAKTVYVNTKIIIGEKAYIFEHECRDVKAYTDSIGDLQIEKFTI